MFFEADVRVLERLEGIEEINGFLFDQYLVRAGDTDIKALVEIGTDIEEGCCLHTDRAYLTHQTTIEGHRRFSLRLEEPYIIDESQYDERKPFMVEVSGMVIKAWNTRIMHVSVYSTPLLTSTLVVHNEQQESAGITLLAFRDFAKQMFDLTNKSVIQVRARLRNRRFKGEYELDVRDMKILRLWQDAIEKEKEGVQYGNA